MVDGNSALSSMFNNCESLSKISIECQNANDYDDVFNSWTERVGAKWYFCYGNNDTTNWVISVKMEYQENGRIIRIPKTNLRDLKYYGLMIFLKITLKKEKLMLRQRSPDPDSYGANAFVYQDEIEYGWRHNVFMGSKLETL